MDTNDKNVSALINGALTSNGNNSYCFKSSAVNPGLGMVLCSLSEFTADRKIEVTSERSKGELRGAPVILATFTVAEDKLAAFEEKYKEK